MAAGVDARLVESVLAASTALVGVAARSMAELDGRVSLVQWRLLVVIHSRGSLPSGRAAIALGMTASSLSRLADRLSAAGLIRRAPSSASRRIVCLDLTEDGRAIVEEVFRRRRRDLRGILSTLPAEERAQLRTALSAFEAAAESYFEGDPPAGL